MSRAGSIGGIFRRRRPAPRPVMSPAPGPGAPASTAPPAPGTGTAPEEAGRRALAERRDALAGDFARHQWDLGGMTYEMASRDHFRLDVLQRHAARLQEIDAELSEAERELRLEDAGAGGTCPSCSAMHARGAMYCWQCGTDLMGTQTVEIPVAQPQQPPPQPAQPAPITHETAAGSEPWTG